jgi:N4-gp56 family major capsid protein
MERLINLQLFADVTAKVTAGGYMNDTEAHEYYERTLKESIYEELTLDKYCDTITLPKNNGKTMVLRKMGKYTAKDQALVEGQLPEEDDPIEIYEYRVSLNDMGGYITYSDQLDIYSLNDGWATRLQRNQGRAVGELFENKIKNIMYASTNRWFAGVADSELTSLANARSKATNFQLDDLRKMRAFMLRTKVKPFSNGEFLFAIDPEVEADILTLEKQDDKFSFVELANLHQKGGQIYSGNELGSFMGFRFVTNPSLGYVTSGNTEIHGSLVLGRYNGELGTKLVKLEGYGAPKTILKALGSAGTNDPLDQKGSIGWKCMGWGGCVLYPEAVLVYESKAGAIAEPFVEKEREHFIGGTDGKNVDIVPNEKADYLNGKKVKSAHPNKPEEETEE